jgi:hypothetical protein
MSAENGEPSDPTPIERLEAADGELAQLSDILTRLWLERHQLYGAIRDVKTLRHHLELARVELGDSDG